MTSHLTTHVLDSVAGAPAAGIAVTLARLSENATEEIATGTTDVDGRIGEFGPARLDAGNYRLTFATGDYFAASGRDTFYPHVTIDVRIDPERAHYHVPILLSPFAYTTYRGS